MSHWEFYDEDEEIDLNEEKEPSFTLYDFKKWLTDQKDSPEPLEENLREQVESTNKDELKEMFKKRVRDKVSKKIDKKMSDRKKKK